MCLHRTKLDAAHSLLAWLGGCVDLICCVAGCQAGGPRSVSSPIPTCPVIIQAAVQTSLQLTGLALITPMSRLVKKESGGPSIASSIRVALLQSDTIDPGFSPLSRMLSVHVRISLVAANHYRKPLLSDRLAHPPHCSQAVARRLAVVVTR